MAFVNAPSSRSPHPRSDVESKTPGFEVGTENTRKSVLTPPLVVHVTGNVTGLQSTCTVTCYLYLRSVRMTGTSIGLR